MSETIEIERKFSFCSNFNWMAVSCLLTGLLSLAIVILFPQESNLKSALIVVLSFIWLSSIFLLSKNDIMTRYDRFIQKHTNYFAIISFLSIILPFFLITIIGGTLTTSNAIFFLAFYLIPVALMIIGLTHSPHSAIRPVIIIASALLLWIGFDHRYTVDFFDGFQDMNYNLTAIWVVLLLITIYAPFNRENYTKVNSKPTFSGIKYSIYMLPVLLAVIVPIGLASGFLHGNVDTTTEPGMKALVFIAIYFTIALPEEFIFRGVILNELDKKYKEPCSKVLSLIFTSFIFGLTHWNNTSPEYIWYYVFFATCAGIAYGFVWRKSGLFGAAFLHATVDWIWQFYLQ